MKILKCATIFKCKLPSVKDLQVHLNDCEFTPVLESMFSSSGFIPLNGEMVTEVVGGFAVTLRYDEKIMPKAALNRLVDERIQKEIDSIGLDDDGEEAEISKERADEIKAEVYEEKLKTALIKTTHIRAFYHAEDNIFLVETVNPTLASIMTARIVQAVGSVEFVTVYLSNTVGDLTRRLKEYVYDETDSNPFGAFTMGSYVKLKDKDDTINIQYDDIVMGRSAIIEAVSRGMEVQQIELYQELVSFKLDKQFRLRAINYTADPEREDELPESVDDPIWFWRNEAGIRLLQIASVVRELLVMFEYKQPELLEPELRDLDEESDNE